MKYINTMLTVLATIFLFEVQAQETLEKEISFYDGLGRKMREEKIFKTIEGKEKVLLAKRILVNDTNELKEIWSSKLGSSGAANNPNNSAVVNEFFNQYNLFWAAQQRQINSAPWQTPCSLDGANGTTKCQMTNPSDILSNCEMSHDLQTITCPDGNYSKTSATVETFRSVHIKDCIGCEKKTSRKSSVASPQ